MIGLYNWNSYLNLCKVWDNFTEDHNWFCECCRKFGNGDIPCGLVTLWEESDCLTLH